jgi:probable HAF family extracellular repeat protein
MREKLFGSANFAGDQAGHAFLWKKGKMTDLGTVGGDTCSVASAINTQGQVVGMSFNCDFSTQHAVLWQNTQIVDLSTLISPNSALYLTRALAINDRGEIAGIGDPASCFFDPGCGQAFVLIPCDENHDDSECEDEGGGTTATIQSSTAPGNQTPTNVNYGSLTPETSAALRARLAQRYHIPGLGAPRD